MFISLLIHIKISSEIPLKTNQEIMFYQLYGHHLSQWNWHEISHHTDYISFALLLQSRKIQLLIPGQDGERQMLSQCQSVEVGTHRPQPTASSVDLELPRRPQHKGWNNALLTEGRYLVRSASLNQSFLTSGSLLIANNRAMGRQVPLLCCKLRPLYLVVRVGKTYWWGWPGAL